MYNIETLNAALLGLIGFYQTQDTTYPLLEADLILSRAGLFLQDEHPILTPENLYHIIPEIAGATIDSVRISDFIRKKMKGSGNRLLRKVLTAKKLNKVTKSIFENIKLFDGAGSHTEKIVKSSRFVGFEVNLKRFDNLVLKVEKVGLQFDTLQAPLKIYLFHTSQTEPVEEWDLTTTKAISLNLLSIPTNDKDTLKYYSPDTTDGGVGGCYYIGYFEDDVSGQSINKNIDFTKPLNGCQKCGKKQGYNLLNKYVDVNPIEVLNADLNGTNLWDIQNTRYVNNTNFGLNLSFSVNCDFTDFFIRNEDVYSNALSKQIAVDLLWDIANQVQTSGIAEKLKQQATFAVMNANGNKGLMFGELDKLVKAIDFDFSDLNSPCLPSNKRGVTFSSV